MAKGTIDLLDDQSVAGYLRARQLIGPGEAIRVQPLSGGVSCQTVLVKRPYGKDMVLKRALEKLNVPADWYADPHRIHIEAAAMRALSQIAPAGMVPALLFEDEQAHVLAMEAVPQPHHNWKELLLSGQVDAGYVRQFAGLLADIHGRSYHQAHLAQAFADRHYFEILRLEPYYLYTAARVPAARPFLEHLVQQTRAHRHCLVHGDYSPKNILIHRQQIVLLDHEVMHYGDGAFDLGFALTHFLSKARHVAGSRAVFRQAARLFWEEYSRLFPLPEGWENRAVGHTLACSLARVCGKSPLEYLSRQERAEQRRWCLDHLADLPLTLPDLINTI